VPATFLPVYSYQAVDANRAATRGTLIADTPRDARDQLRRRGLVPRRLEAAGAVEPATGVGAGAAAAVGGAGAGPGRRSEAADLFRELSTLLGVGVGVLEALDLVIAQVPARHQRWATQLMGVRDRVSAGSALGDALAAARWKTVLGGSRALFDEATVAMVAVGEDAGALADVSTQVADHLEQRAALKNRLAGALTYPAVVAVFGAGVCVFLMTWVVPGILDALAESGQPLPPLTLAVKAVSDFLLNWGLVVLLGLALAAVAAGIALGRPAGRARFDALVLRLPGIGPAVRRQAVVRLAFVLEALLDSGVRFERALGIGRRAVRNVVLQDALARCEAAVREGRDLGPALAETDAFPATVARVFALGQTSGRLGELLGRLGRSYDRQLRSRVDRLTTLIEPTLIILLAAVVGVIAFATLLPILEIGDLN